MRVGHDWARWRRGLLRELGYLAVLGTPVVLFFLVAAPRANAVRLLRQVAAMRPGATPFADVSRLAAGMGAYAACDADGCDFQFQNRWLHRLRLAPLTQFSVLIRRDGARAGAISLAMYVAGAEAANDPSPTPIASALVFDTVPAAPAPNFQATITLDRAGRPVRTVVVLAPGATGPQRRRAQAFNLTCLTRLGGCKSSRDELPTVWQQARRIPD